MYELTDEIISIADNEFEHQYHRKNPFQDSFATILRVCFAAANAPQDIVTEEIIAVAHNELVRQYYVDNATIHDAIVAVLKAAFAAVNANQIPTDKKSRPTP